MLASKEIGNSFFKNLPMQVSAISTLTSGVLMMGNTDHFDDNKKYAAKAAVAVGLSWVGVNYYLAMRANFYQDVMADYKKLSAKTPREKLIRERIAEEGIYSTARLMHKLKWLSVVTNAGANAYMMSKVEKDSISEVTNIFSLAAAFAPLIFKSEWEKQSNIHRKNKKKIYGPIVTSSIFQVGKKKVVPGVLLTLAF